MDGQNGNGNGHAISNGQAEDDLTVTGAASRISHGDVSAIIKISQIAASSQTIIRVLFREFSAINEILDRSTLAPDAMQRTLKDCLGPASGKETVYATAEVWALEFSKLIDRMMGTTVIKAEEVEEDTTGIDDPSNDARVDSSLSSVVAEPDEAGGDSRAEARVRAESAPVKQEAAGLKTNGHRRKRVKQEEVDN